MNEKILLTSVQLPLLCKEKNSTIATKKLLLKTYSPAYA